MSALSYKVYQPQNPKAVVFCVHGMQEHQNRYIEFANLLVNHGYACITYDLPGHGETKDRGYFGDKDGWKQLVASAHSIALKAKQLFPNIPCIYFGHSMGTIIGRVFLQEHDDLIDACVLSGIPNYRPESTLGILLAKCIATIFGKRKTSTLLEYLAIGSFNQAIENPNTNVDWLSHNPENVQSFLEDEWCGFPFTNQGYVDLFTLMKKMGTVSLYQCKHPSLPMYIFAGEDDPCIGGKKGFQKSIEILKRAGYTNMQTKLFPKMRHETFHEVDAEEVMKTVVKWLDANV